MSKKSLVWIAALTMALNLSACSFWDEKSDGESVQDVEALEEGAPAASTEEALTSDALPEDALGAATEKESTTPTETAGTDDLSIDAPTDTSSAPADPPMMSDSTGFTPSDSATTDSPTMETPAMSPEEPAPSADTASMEPPAEEKPKISAPLQKIASKPWKVGSEWINAVYFARPGNTLSSISQTIYGEDRSSSLKKANPTYRSRDPRPGDKVYYSSSKRPDDSEQVLTFHEETGSQPETYVAKSGDNIRKVSKDLLGYDGAWKEVWSSNLTVDSKGELTEGTELRFWRNVAAAPTSQQQTTGNMEGIAPAPEQPPQETAAMPPMEESPPPPPAPNDFPPPPPDAAAGMTNDLPPPPMPDQAMNDLPPPPPPVEAVPPPPPPMGDNNGPSAEEEATAMDDDTVMALGMVAVAAAGIAALLVTRRRRKQREMMESQIGDSTHVGT